MIQVPEGAGAAGDAAAAERSGEDGNVNENP